MEKKRGPKSEKELFFQNAKEFGISLAEAEKKWAEKMAASTKKVAGKIVNERAEKAEQCVLLAKAFGGLSIDVNTDRGQNRDLNRIGETFGKVQYKIENGQNCASAGGYLPISQGALWFNPDAPLRKFTDLLYSLATCQTVTVRKGTPEDQILDGLISVLRTSMEFNEMDDQNPRRYDGKAAQAAILPAFWAGLETVRQVLSGEIESSDIIGESAPANSENSAE